MSTRLVALFRGAALLLAPALLLAGGFYHPWIGTPGDAGFLSRLGAAVTGGPGRWATAHLLLAVGSATLALAFLAVRSHLRESSGDGWSRAAVPFVVFGSTLYALLPALEFGPLVAAASGGDAARAQAALLPWFRPILLSAALSFALGAFGFAAGIARARVLGPLSTWLVVLALLVLAATRFVPVGVAQLYIGPVVSLVALWPLALVVGRSPGRGSPAASRLSNTARA